jgi:hypothetical protein
LLNRSSLLTKSLSTYLEKRLITDHELIIYLGPHNLHHPSLGVLFQSEYELPAGDPAQALSLTSNDKTQIIEGLQEVSNSIGAEVFTLWGGFQDEKVHEPQPGEESLVDKLAVNDEAILERWNPSSMRLSVPVAPPKKFIADASRTSPQYDSEHP